MPGRVPGFITQPQEGSRMSSHTLPVTPGAIIGYRRNGTPIRLAAGGSEPAPEPAGQPPATDPGMSAPAPGPQPPAAPDAPPAADGAPASGQEPPAEPADSVDKLPSWAQKLLKDTRNEAAANRARAKEHADELATLKTQSQQQLDGIAKALGLKPEEATPEQIAAERDAERQRAQEATVQARQAAVELAVFRAAAGAGADGNALLDSRSFVATLAGLDPSADGFAERVKDAIVTAVEGNERYKIPAPPAPPVPAPKPPPAVPSSGPGQFTGPPSGPRQWTQEDVDAASPAEVFEAQSKGLLVGLGFGPSRKSRR